MFCSGSGGVHEDGAVRLGITDENEVLRVLLSSNNDALTFLSLYDGDGQERNVMSVDKNGRGRLHLLDESGKVIWSNP